MLFKKEIVSQGEKMACQIYPRAFLFFSHKAQVIALFSLCLFYETYFEGSHTKRWHEQ